VAASDAYRAIDAVWRIESPRLIAGLAGFVRDVGVAEDLAQDALVAPESRSCCSTRTARGGIGF
jgi:predicted RNA polymerase sigma factor